MEIILAVVSPIIGCLCTPSRAHTTIVGRCSQIISPTKEIGKLGKIKQKLVAQVADINTRLRTEEMEHQKSRTHVVHKWLNDVKNVLSETDAIEHEAQTAKRCLNGLLPNCCSRSNLGQRISELIKEVTSLSEYGGNLSTGSLTHLVPEKGMELPTTELVGETTAEKTLEMVWDCLMDEEIKIVGVYGMGGVGKTTIMTCINNRLLEQENRFDKVIWVTVSKDANVHKVQHYIAKEVDLDLSSEQDLTTRSSLLLRALRKRGRIVFILDDMWEAFSPHEIGIPDFTEDNGCKLVLTTRLLEVCQRMRCKKEIKVELLPNDEAWKLFTKTVGSELGPEIEKIAKAIVKECAGLPLAIITIGGAMAGNTDIVDWGVALIDLRESTSWILNMEDQVIKCLEFSYNRLGKDDRFGEDVLKKCFLYCALYPEDFEIDPEELIDHWVMEGLIKQGSIGDELDRGRFILNKLKRCSMLEYGFADRGDWEYVKMHDLIRDMALHITKTNPQFMVKAGVKLKKLPDEKEWGENLEKVSFMESDINKILISPNCCGLVTLLFNHTPLKHISHNFFVQMQGLRVLNLSNTEIEMLPDSISELVNLHTLDVSWCKLLKKVPSLEKLLLLRVLRLVETAIEELPHGMESLVNLTRLDLTRIRLKEIPALLISKFSLLQELLMYPLHHPIGFVDELLSLEHLENLSISFNDLSDFIQYVRLENFKHLNYFFFNVRHGLDMSEFHQTRRKSVTIRNDSQHIPKNVLRLPQSTEYLGIMEFNELNRLSELPCLKDAKELKKCFIRECSEMEYILFPEEDDLLQKLEDMSIKGCRNLVTLQKGIPARGTLSCLKKLYISKCHNLKYLFSSKLFTELKNLVEVYVDCCELEELIIESEEEMGEGTSSASRSLKKLKLVKLPKLKTLFSKKTLRYFQNLEEVDVLYCNGMKELIAAEEVMTEGSSSSSKHDTLILPRLKKLDLVNLPELKSIWRGEMVCDSLQSVRVNNCLQLKRLPQFSGEDHSPPLGLKQIKGSREWWDSMEWDGPFAKILLQPFFQDHW